jgi:hypothetical protein
MRQFLELDPEDEPIGFFILGEAGESSQRPPRMRIPVAQKTKWIRK